MKQDDKHQRPHAIRYVFNAGKRTPAKIITGQVRTDANGVATFYFTDDGTNTGMPLLTTIFSYPTDYQHTSQLNIRKSPPTANSITATVTQIVTTSIVITGIPVLNGLTYQPMANILVDFTIIGI